MLAGARSDNGSLFITETLPANFQMVGGVVVDPLGSIWINTTLSPHVFANGFGVLNSGELCVKYGGPIDQWQHGLPFSNDGRLICQLNQVIVPSDPFVGGIRVGPLGGVYVIDLTPPVAFAFADGFNGGFS